MIKKNRPNFFWEFDRFQGDSQRFWLNQWQRLNKICWLEKSKIFKKLFYNMGINT